MSGRRVLADRGPGQNLVGASAILVPAAGLNHTKGNTQAQPDSAPSSSCPLQHAPSPQEHMAQTEPSSHSCTRRAGPGAAGPRGPRSRSTWDQVAGASPEPSGGWRPSVPRLLGSSTAFSIRPSAPRPTCMPSAHRLCPALTMRVGSQPGSSQKPAPGSCAHRGPSLTQKSRLYLMFRNRPPTMAARWMTCVGRTFSNRARVCAASLGRARLSAAP